MQKLVVNVIIDLIFSRNRNANRRNGLDSQFKIWGIVFVALFMLIPFAMAIFGQTY